MAEARAVLTGDLVGSGRASEAALDHARNTIRETLEALPWEERLAQGPVDFFRGDAWQALLARPRWSLRAALLLRARLRAEGAPDTRVALAIGGVGRVDASRISRSSGEAFVRSGRALDALPRAARFTAEIADANAGAENAWLRVVASLCDAWIRDWTRRRAAIIAEALALRQPRHAEIAARLDPPVAQQTVTGALNASGWRGVWNAVETWERRF